jgi:hypothetical protein
MRIQAKRLDFLASAWGEQYMPLDDTNWPVPTVDAANTFPTLAPRRVVSRPCRRSRLSPDRVVLTAVKVVLAGAALGFISFVSDLVFPDAGLITRLTEGNAVANRNYVGRQILLDGQKIKFTVAGHRYEVVAPSRSLTADEQQALLGYAAWVGFPAYPADGPLTIDP